MTLIVWFQNRKRYGCMRDAAASLVLFPFMWVGGFKTVNGMDACATIHGGIFFGFGE